MTKNSSGPVQAQHPFSMIALVLIIGIIISAVLFYFVQSLQRDKAMNHLQDIAEERSFALQSEVNVLIESLYAISGLYAATDYVDAEDFHIFNLYAARGFQNEHTLRWLPAVQPEQLDAFLRQSVIDGYENYKIQGINEQGSWSPVTAQEIHYPVYHVFNPEHGVSDIKQGHDLYSHPDYRQLFTADTPTEAVTSFLPSIESARTGERYIEIFYPVLKPFKQGHVHESTLSGYINLEIDLQSLVEQSLQRKAPSSEGLDVYLWDEKTRLAYYHMSRSRTEAAEAGTLDVLGSEFYATATIRIADQTFSIMFVPIQDYFDYTKDWAQWLVLAISMAATLLLSSYLYTLQRRRKIVDKLVARRTYELLESREKVRSILDTVIDGIITINDHGIVQSFNPAAEKIFGYRADMVIGRNVKMLMPDPYAREHDGYLKNYMETHEARIIGAGREVTGLRRDGSTFPLDLAVSEMNLGDNKMFTGIVRDITERKKMEMMKSEFVSTVSHELRTPLTSIRGALGLVLGGALGELPEKAKNMLEVANRNSERLTLLINDILDLEKIESGKIQFEYTNLDIVQLAQQAVEANQAYAIEHDVRLVLAGNIPATIVYADGHRLLQVFANLISNAVKFSPEQGVVEVSVTHNDKAMIRVSIRDYGPGISEEFQSRIFQRFAQADSSDSREKGGTGLGLSISQSIIEDHGGNIDFTSPAGGGAEFYFELPVAKDDTVVADKQSQILICEDNTDVALVLKNMLENEGVSSDIATSAAAARRLLSSKSYRALLLDIALPDQNGLEMIAELKQSAATADMPIIVVSAMAHEGRSEFSGNGIEVIDWMQKPVDEQRLMKSLWQVLGKDNHPRILHIEDDVDVVQIVSELLNGSADYEYVSTVQAAHDLLVKQAYDLVIIDINLPDGSGLEVLPAINEKCPVIVFSGGEPEHELKSRISAYLTKANTSNEQLLATIMRVINKSMEKKHE